MKSDRHWLIFMLTSFIFFLLPFASYADVGSPFNKIVFFGDSLSDDGNLFAIDFDHLPKSPPYFQGRFSNGYVWSEYAAKYFYDQKYMASENYAVGGETTYFHNPFSGYIPYTLNESVDDYLFDTLFQNRQDTLFIIWIGSNDYLKGTTDVNGLTSQVTITIRQVIKRLMYYGGVNFLVINVPDFSHTPLAEGEGPEVQQMLHEEATLHNMKLAAIISSMHIHHPEINIHLFDLNGLFSDVVNNINFYNQKYHVNITNTTQACWQGGYTRKKVLTENDILQQLQNQPKISFAIHYHHKGMRRLSEKELAHYVATTPALLEVYRTSQSAAAGDMPCTNPDNYIFWDHIHPTGIVHMLLAQNFIDFINANYQAKS